MPKVVGLLIGHNVFFIDFQKAAALIHEATRWQILEPIKVMYAGAAGGGALRRSSESLEKPSRAAPVRGGATRVTPGNSGTKR